MPSHHSIKMAKVQNERYDRFRVGSASTSWQPCPADYASILKVGDIGMVSFNPPLPNDVRRTPSLSGERIGQLQPGEKFVILDGPICEGGWIWWYVQNATNLNNEVLRGWTTEGDLNNRLLVPLDPEGSG